MMQAAPMIVTAEEVRIVLSTAESREEAERIARALVEQRLAACVNLIPGLTSIYRWQGAVQTADEILLLIKTTTANLTGVAAALRELHSYEVPEFLVLDAEAASSAYLSWLLESTNPEGSERSEPDET
jgi:periplasmic divalent cation tolerance protein